MIISFKRTLKSQQLWGKGWPAERGSESAPQHVNCAFVACCQLATRVALKLCHHLNTDKEELVWWLDKKVPLLQYSYHILLRIWLIFLLLYFLSKFAISGFVGYSTMIWFVEMVSHLHYMLDWVDCCIN